MTVPLIDTHCHLDFKAFDADRQETLKRSWETGLVRILIPGTDLASSRAALTLSIEEARISCAVGIHPTSAGEWNGERMMALDALSSESQVCAIGEIGLDYYWKDVAPETQRCALEAQLDLAAKRSLPVIIHCREAFPDTLAIVASWRKALQARNSPLNVAPGVFHAFSGTPEEAGFVLDMGFYLGVTGVVTFPKAETLRQVVQEAPLERLLIETDSPYLAPQAYRGKRNEPAYVLQVAEKIAGLRGISLEETGAVTTRNAIRLFHWEEPV